MTRPLSLLLAVSFACLAAAYVAVRGVGMWDGTE